MNTKYVGKTALRALISRKSRSALTVLGIVIGITSIMMVVSAGQVVRGGDIIGYEGNTGNTTRLLYGPEAGYHLHFTVFDEEGFGIKHGQYSAKYGSYDIPYGYTYNPKNFLK